MKKIMKVLCVILSLLMIFSLSACKEETPEPSSSVQSSSTPKKPNGQMVGEEGETAAGIWTGLVAEGVAKGGGTEEFPFYIYTAEELAWAVTEGGKDGYYYQLQNDIYLNDVSSDDWFKNENNNPWVAATGFNGGIDGNGYCIYGIWFNSKDLLGNAGLFQTMEKGKIKNLGIRKSFIVSEKYAGGFAGITSGSGKKIFENCFVDETVYVHYAAKGNNGAGGLIGYAAGSSEDESTLDILNCYSKAQITGRSTGERVNGIIGTAWTCSYTMKNCYSIGQAPYFGGNSSTASTLLTKGKAATDVYSGIYTDTRDAAKKESFKKLSLSKMKNSGAANSLAGFDFASVWEAVEGGTPKLKVFAGIDGKDIKVTTPIADLQVVISEFTSGLGTKEKPFVVTTPEQLRKVVTSGWNGTYFSLGNDIYVNDVGSASWALVGQTWVPTTSTAFAGYFEGNGFSVHGLLLSETPQTGKNMGGGGTGLFPVIAPSAVIRNVHLKNSNIVGKTNVGGIAGSVGGNKNSGCAQIIGCTVDETVVLRGQTVGGIVGSGGGGVNIAYCGFSGVIAEATGTSGANNRGNGIVGDIWSNNYRIAECYTANYYVYRKQYKPSALVAVYGPKAQDGVSEVPTANMLGQAACSSMPDLNWSAYWTATETYPKPIVIPADVEYVF